MSQRLTAKRDELQAQVYLCQQLQVREWIQLVLGSADFGEDFATALQSGEILCQVMNAVREGIVPVIRSEPTRRIENIDNFFRACREIGVADASLFEANDLLGLKNMAKVIKCLMSLISVVRDRI
jgi:hypothetical protein